ncbi:FecR domain-containing protein [Sphingobacterium chuzhouense]|uniref:FecR domain-containing protein n=1 Tax=Sphingobacterium chuzhouense TaxID=1742264 RepID=A0ABR7XXD8_9SPHI|nr:FecR domain-containing protein [Sphingobacterium chuzhouense]MBD1423731.1 FecR domain-containing protein [Sphingobacterium chuzhouense]
MKNTKRIIYLLRKNIEGQLTAEERQELDLWMNDDPVRHQFVNELSDPKRLLAELATFDEAYDEDILLQRIYTKAGVVVPEDEISERNPRRWRKLLPYAAAVLFFLTLGVLYWHKDSSPEKPVTDMVVANDIAPGGQKAVLTLADGRKIALSGDQGTIILRNDSAYYPDGSPVLTDDDAYGNNHLSLSISVPKGGIYKVVLSDGTAVWLNSSSTLRYPRRFAGKQRRVELEGEAYFEVSSLQENGQHIPFFVRTRSQEIEVLGTQFNVSAYHDMPETTTTLVEGRVSVAIGPNSSDRFLLEPGYQSVVTKNDRSVQKVDIAQFVAWKDGLFLFKNTSFEQMMSQISRWYDVDVMYKGNIPHESFTGKMSRQLSLLTVLELLNVSNVNVQIQDKKLIVN